MLYLLLVPLLFFSCQKQTITEKNPTSSYEKELTLSLFEGIAMEIPYRILVGKTFSEEEKKEAQALIEQTFEEVNQIYNNWNPHSEISQFNRAKKDEKIALSLELYRFLKQVERIVYLSDGRFDPTVEPLNKLWKKSLEKNQKPKEFDLAITEKAVGWHHITLRDKTISKDHDLTQIDLGGIAKGYCVDLILERFIALGYSNCFVEWGGDIRVSGEHPQKRAWIAAISDFKNTQKILEEIHLSDQALATSGDYYQNWQVDDSSYFHIFDTKTKKPLMIDKDRIASASVIAPSCLLADAFATVLMTFPSEKQADKWTKKIQQEIPDIQVFLFTR